MAIARTAHGALHYDLLDQVVPWQAGGLPILFHHGIGSSAELWAGWQAALADRHRLVSFDMRGCGRSHIPAADFKWSLDLLVDDLFAVADAAGLHASISWASRSAVRWRWPRCSPIRGGSPPSP